MGDLYVDVPKMPVICQQAPAMSMLGRCKLIFAPTTRFLETLLWCKWTLLASMRISLFTWPSALVSSDFLIESLCCCVQFSRLYLNTTVVLYTFTKRASRILISLIVQHYSLIHDRWVKTGHVWSFVFIPIHMFLVSLLINRHCNFRVSC